MHQTEKLKLITEPIKCDAYGCQGQCMQEWIINRLENYVVLLNSGALQL